MADISVGSVSVTVVPDARLFREKLDALLSGLTVEIRATLDDTLMRAQLDEFTRSRDLTVNANLDDAMASAELDVLTRDRSVDINAGGSALSPGTFEAASAGAGGLAGNLGLLIPIAGALAPALIPVTAAIAGLAGALAAPAFAAGGGLAVFAVGAAAIIAKAKADEKQIATLQKAIQSASTKATRDAAKAQLATFMAGLPKDEKKLMDTMDALTGAFQKFMLSAAGHAVFATLTDAIGLLTKMMVAFQPVIIAVSSTLSGLIDGISKAASGSGFKDFIAFFSTAAAQGIQQFATMLENVAVGIQGLFVAFAPFTDMVLNGLVKATAAFARFGQSASTNKGFQNFLAYAEAALPKVLELLGGMIAAGRDLVSALRPFGDVILGALVRFFDLFKAPLVQQYFRQIGATAQQAFGIIGKSIQQNKPFLMELGRAITQLVIPALAGVVVGMLAMAHGIAQGIAVAHRFTDAMLGAASAVLKGFQWLLRGVMKVFGGILDAAVAALGWIPLYSGPLKHAQEMFNALGNNANQQLSSMVSHIQAVHNAIDGLPTHKTFTYDIFTIHHIQNKVSHQLGSRSGDPGQFGSPLVPNSSGGTPLAPGGNGMSSSDLLGGSGFNEGAAARAMRSAIHGARLVIDGPDGGQLAYLYTGGRF